MVLLVIRVSTAHESLVLSHVPRLGHPRWLVYGVGDSCWPPCPIRSVVVILCYVDFIDNTVSTVTGHVGNFACCEAASLCFPLSFYFWQLLSCFALSSFLICSCLLLPHIHDWQYFSTVSVDRHSQSRANFLSTTMMKFKPQMMTTSQRWSCLSVFVDNFFQIKNLFLSEHQKVLTPYCSKAIQVKSWQACLNQCRVVDMDQSRPSFNWRHHQNSATRNEIYAKFCHEK